MLSPLSVGSLSLKDAQIAAIQRMLSFNVESAANLDNDNLPPVGSPANQWKILVYDSHCRAIISPIMTVPQLRRRGVTLHLLLDSIRERIADVPAVYFVQPTRENLARIAKDCSTQLYQRIHLNFCTKLDRTLMEEFAKLVVGTGGQASLSQIASVHDQYTDFVCYEKRLFSLAVKDSYVLYNSPSATEAALEQAMTDIAYGLFSVVATVGQVPVIRCPRVRACLYRRDSFTILRFHSFRAWPNPFVLAVCMLGCSSMII
jgi:sec1 family domain-containing protein 1